ALAAAVTIAMRGQVERVAGARLSYSYDATSTVAITARTQLRLLALKPLWSSYGCLRGGQSVTLPMGQLQVFSPLVALQFQKPNSRQLLMPEVSQASDEGVIGQFSFAMSRPDNRDLSYSALDAIASSSSLLRVTLTEATANVGDIFAG